MVTMFGRSNRTPSLIYEFAWLNFRMVISKTLHSMRWQNTCFHRLMKEGKHVLISATIVHCKKAMVDEKADQFRIDAKVGSV
jgi:hypothetical protein